MMTKLRPMASRLIFALAVSLAITAAGCGAAYEAGTEIRAHRMADDLKVGESTVAVGDKWGQPDLRQDVNPSTEIWSYAKNANTNDVAAMLLYTSAKEGDKGRFLDLTFVNAKLSSWQVATHTLPSKQSTSINLGIGPGPTVGSPQHY